MTLSTKSPNLPNIQQRAAAESSSSSSARSLRVSTTVVHVDEDKVTGMKKESDWNDVTAVEKE